MAPESPFPPPAVLRYDNTDVEAELRHRNSHHHRHHHHDHDSDAGGGVKALPFAGRIGGNLTLLSGDRKTPDATKLHSWGAACNLGGFTQPIYIKAATIECIATGMMVFIGGLTDAAFGAFLATSTPLGWSMSHALVTWFIITLFLYAAAPPSGGHLNPFITISTLLAGLCTLPRAVYYITGQLLGALAGGFLLKLGLGSGLFFPAGPVGGCTFDFGAISRGQAFVLEFGCYFSLAFIAFGVGLDPRQGQVFGPAYGPVLVGAAVALCSFGTGAVHPGWSGASLNPARCFGLMAAKRDLGSSWIHWLAALTAAALNGLLYNLIPPNPSGPKPESSPI